MAPTTIIRKKTCTSCGQYLYLKDFYPAKPSCRFLANRYPKCKNCMRREKREEYARNRKVKDGVILRNGRVVDHKGASTRIHWGALKEQDFRRLFPVTRNEDLAIDFGCSVRTIVRRAREMNLQKTEAFTKYYNKKALRLAHIINKIQGNKADLTNFIAGGIPHRFKTKSPSPSSPVPADTSAGITPTPTAP